MKHLKTILILAVIISLSSCARGCESIDRAVQMTDKPTIIEQYSGGKLINKWEINGIVNSSTSSDGYYFTYNDTLIEVSGDIVIKMIDK